MPFRTSDVRRAQKAFDLVLEETIYEAEITLNGNQKKMTVEVEDPNKKKKIVARCVFEFERVEKKDAMGMRVAQPTNDELKEMAAAFGVICAAYGN